jgi:predicted alpha/beta hydrolase family esterase
MKRVVLVHGWDGSPKKGWFPWLKKELELKSFKVLAPQLPEPDKPRIYNWIPKLIETVGIVDKDTYFVGHSMGCQAIARFIVQLPENSKVGGIVFVAGFFKHLTGLEDDAEVQKTDKHWLKSPINLSKVKKHILKSIAIFSDNDPWVPLDNQDDYRNKLGSKILIVKNMEHIGDSYKKVPVILEQLLGLAR